MFSNIISEATITKLYTVSIRDEDINQMRKNSFYQITQGGELTSKTASTAIRGISYLLSCPGLKVSRMCCFVEAVILCMRSLHCLESTFILANATYSNTQAVVKFGIGYRYIGGVCLQAQTVISIVDNPVVKSDI